MKINWTKLNKYLKGDNTVWGYYEGFHYISNGHFMLKVTELDKKTQAVLLNTFGNFPDDSKKFMILRGGHVTHLGEEFKEVMDKSEPDKVLRDTGLRTLKTVNNKSYDISIFTDNEEYYYFNKDYMNIADMKNSILKCNGPLNPMFVIDNLITNMMILPMRITDDNNYLKDLNKNE